MKYFKALYYYIFHPVYRINIKIFYMYKISNFFLKKNIKILSEFFSYRLYRKCHIIISPSALLKGLVYFPHPMGIVIGEGVKIGKHVTIYQNVTLGRKYMGVAEYPIIEDNAIIYSNSVIIGKVCVRKNTIIGANSVLFTDTEENSVYVGNPARRVK